MDKCVTVMYNDIRRKKPLILSINIIWEYNKL